MGEEKILYCTDCKEYVDIDKMPLPRFDVDGDFPEFYDHAPNYQQQTMKLLSFLSKHRNSCHIQVLGEYSMYQDKWVDVCLSEETQEFSL